MNLVVSFARFIGAVAICISVAGAASADGLAGSPAPGQYKIGVVNVKKVFDGYKKQTDEYALLQSVRDEKQSQIDDLSEKIQRNKDRYEAEQASMSPDERRDLEELIESDYSRYKAEFKRLQEDIDRREKKLLESLFKEIHLTIQEIGTKNNFHLILEGGETGRSGLLYFSTPLNMTQQVTDYINEKYESAN